MRTVQQLLEIQLTQAWANQEIARKSLADPSLSRNRSKFRKMLQDAQQIEAATAAELSKFAYLK